MTVTGCASVPRVEKSALPATSFEEIDSVPFFAQAAYQCGPAALAMMLNWAGIPTTPDALADKLYIADLKGSLQIELVAAARQLGLLPYAHQGNLEDLWQMLARGTPVLVLQNLGFTRYPRWHYAVVVGYDAHGQELLLRSGQQRLRRESVSVFNSTWQHSDFWMLSIHRPGEMPAIATEQEFLSAANGLESTGHQLAALRFYEAATQRWPESMLAWLAVGNAHYRNSRFVEAERAYRQARLLARHHPAPAHNLAWALIKRDLHEAAKTYAMEALTLSQSVEASEPARYHSAAEALGLIPQHPAAMAESVNASHPALPE